MNARMAKEELKKNLIRYVNDITQASKGVNMYVCPICASGTGPNATGAFSIQENGLNWKCFSCGEGGDIFDLIGLVEGIKDYSQQLARACELFNVDTGKGQYQKEDKKEQYTHSSMSISADTEQTDYGNFFLEAQENINNTDYPQRRGLGEEVIKRFKLGYVKEWKPPKAPNAPSSPRLIIPTSDYSYLARDVREDLPEALKKYAKQKTGKTHIFNIQVLKNSTKPIIVTEGEIDALSIIEVGGEAVALGSVTKGRDFLREVENIKPKVPIVLALDNDVAGERATKQIQQGLEEMGIISYRFNLDPKYKDVNEALIQNREKLAEAVQNVMSAEEDEERAKKEAYLQNSSASRLQDFINGIRDSVFTPHIPTGFKNLDEALDGGLYEGLYVIGAISSLGKTTLALQIADQIAESGTDVLIVSLEMARAELMAKSISRHTMRAALDGLLDTSMAKTSRGITQGERYRKYSQEEEDLVKYATTLYGSYAHRVFIMEGIGDIGAEDIRQMVSDHIQYTGNTPVVVVDYLQILAPADLRASDKQNIDRSVLELKRISRDYKTPVIGISSFNRANYKTAVSMEAFKESGAIEYSSDVLIGLQLQGAGEPDFDATNKKKEYPRKIELVILKNRNGAIADGLNFKYHTKFNLFSEEQGK